MDAAQDGPYRLTKAMRVVLVVFLVLAGIAFILLYLRSGGTDREFAWTIKPESTAAFLGAVARFSDQVHWHEPGAWIWLALLVNAIVTGGYQLLATAGGTAEGEPAIIR